MTSPDETADEAAAAVVIERTFDAAVAVVWRMWTVPELFQQWYGPFGASIPVAEMDVRVGGTRRVCMEMEGPDGPHRMWFTGEYREVVEDERLVYTELVEGAQHGGPTEVRVELADLGGRTHMVMTHTGIPADSPGATGWAMAIDALAAALA